MNKWFALLASLLLLQSSAFSAETASPLRTLTPPNERGYLQVLPLAPDRLLLLSEKNLYRADVKLKETKRIFELSGTQKMKKVAFEARRIFLLNEKGLFMSEDEGARWKNITPSPMPQNQMPTSLEATRETLLLAGTGGIFVAEGAGERFQKIGTFEPSETVLEIKAVSRNIFFVMSDRHLWKTRDGGISFELLLSSLPSEQEPENILETGTVEEIAEPSTRGGFTSLAIDPEGQVVWLGSNRGLLKSRKGGLQFEKVKSSTLNTQEIVSLTWTSSGLLAGTRNNIYLENSKGWAKLADIDFTHSLRGISHYQGSVLAVSEDGVFNLSLPYPEASAPQEFRYDPDIFQAIEVLMQQEPSVGETQRAAIRYSNTPNGKIRSWQILSRLRSLVPGISYSVGRSRGNSIDLDRGGTADPDRYITGPESWDKDRDVSLNWDLGDLLFSSSQTSIDSRDKLMVELREEIVSEVTRLYFERRKLQLDLLFEKPDGKDLANLLLQIEERTAQIDGLTGGHFSRRLKPSPFSSLLLAIKQKMADGKQQAVASAH